MPKALRDNYANKFYGTVTESAANTLTFAEIQTNISIFEKVAWVLQRLEWYLSPAVMQLLQDNQDSVELALTASQNISALGLDNPSVIDVLVLSKFQATGVGFEIQEKPVIRDFTGLAGGGLIIAPRPLFLAAKGTTLASAATVQVRGYFQMIELKAEEYLDLVDFYRIVS